MQALIGALPWLLISVPLAVIVHELGHAAFGRLAGLQIKRIAFGFGRTLAKFQIGKTELQLNAAIFSGGYCQPYPPLVWAPWREALFSVGGLLANAIAAIALCLVLWHSELSEFAEFTVILFASPQLALAIGTAIPRKTARGGTDGYHLLGLYWGKSRLKAGP